MSILSLRTQYGTYINPSLLKNTTFCPPNFRGDRGAPVGTPYRDGGLGIQSIWGDAESEAGQARTGLRSGHSSYIGEILGGGVQFFDESDRVLDLYRWL